MSKHFSKPITWIPVSDGLPDDEMTVLIALSDGEVWTGFHEDDQWRYCSADPVDQGEGTTVTQWAEFPMPPSNEEPEFGTVENPPSGFTSENWSAVEKIISDKSNRKSLAARPKPPLSRVMLQAASSKACQNAEPIHGGEDAD